MTNPFTANPDDAAIKLLQTIFGDVITKIVSGATVSSAANTSALMLGEAFRYFNSGVLVFGTFILTWVTIFGVANSANDGEVLGKTWNTFYTPIRTVSAAAVLIPTSSGYAGIQIIMLVIVTWSIGFASTMWTGVVNFTIGQDVATEAANSITTDPNFDSTMMSSIRMGVCAQAVNKAISTVTGMNYALTLKTPTSSVISASDGQKGTLTKIYYADDTWPGSDSICGKITLSDLSTSTSTSNADTAQLLRQQIAQTRSGYILNMFTTGFVPGEVGAIVQTADTDNQKISAGTLNAAVTSAKQNMLNGLRQQVTASLQGTNAGLVQNLTSQGWIYAGSYWMNIARIKDAVRSATQSQMQFTSGTGDLSALLPPGDIQTAANTVMTKYTGLADQLTSQAMSLPPSVALSANPGVPVIQSSFTLNDFTDGGSGIRATLTQWFNVIGNSMVAGMIHFMQGSSGEDPVMRVKSLGDYMSTFAEGVYFSKMTVTAAMRGVSETASTSAAPGASLAAGFVKAALSLALDLWTLVAPSLFTLMYLGYFLGIWLPMVPYYVFAIGVVGWLVFVVEMMAAGVLWAAAHTTPARDNSFIGSQMQGYMLLMSGFFRPALMVLGLVASNAVLSPAISFINDSFIMRMQSLQQDSVTGIMSVAGYMVVYCSMLFSVFTLIFGLPQTLPDRILRWIGAGVGDLGEQHTMSDIKGAASGQARAAALKGMSGAGAIASKDAQEKQNAINEQRGAASAAATRADNEQRDQRLMSGIADAVRKGSAPMTDTGPGADIGTTSGPPRD